MSSVRTSPRRAACLGGLLLAGAMGCSGTASRSAEGPRSGEATNVAAYFPEQSDVVCRYRVESSRSGDGMYWLRIRQALPGRVDIESSGQVRRLEVTPGRAADTKGGFLLVAPLKENSHWQGRSGDVRVSKTNVDFESSPRVLHGCIETVESRRLNGARRQETLVFCPGTGIASIQTTEFGAEGISQQEVATLLGCDAPESIQQFAP